MKYLPFIFLFGCTFKPPPVPEIEIKEEPVQNDFFVFPQFLDIKTITDTDIGSSVDILVNEKFNIELHISDVRSTWVFKDSKAIKLISNLTNENELKQTFTLQIKRYGHYHLKFVEYHRPNFWDNQPISAFDIKLNADKKL